MRALVVHSGGLDSTVALCWARKWFEGVSAISFYYGQKHRIEVAFAQDICDYLSVPWTSMEVHLGEGGALMGKADMPQMSYEELALAEGPSPTYVPYRNGTFLSLAASQAIASGVDVVVAGMHADDAHNWAYPDCTPEFIGAMQNAIYVGSYHKVRLSCPFTYMEKVDIVRIGIDLGAPLEMTMSCYEGTVPACGTCPTCVSRLEAFKKAGVVDPISYKGGVNGRA